MPGLNTGNIYIHIGMPKTASRTFQYHYFTEHDDITHVGKKKPDPTDFECGFIDTITGMERWEYRMNRDEIIERYVDRLFDSGGRYVVSAEGFSTGTSRSGQVDRYTIAKRLSRLFSDGQIVVVLRNQLDALQSMYRQRLKYHPDIGEFDEWIEEKRDREYQTTLLDYLNYYDLLRMYASEFGHQNLHVLFFEELLRDESAFVGALSNTLGISPRPKLIRNRNENPSLRTYTLLWQRAKDTIPALSAVPKLLPESVKQRIKQAGSKIEVSYTENQETGLKRRFGESNSNLQSEFGISPEKYGYPL
jgi:hypothetical protein